MCRSKTADGGAAGLKRKYGDPHIRQPLGLTPSPQGEGYWADVVIGPYGRMEVEAGERNRRNPPGQDRRSCPPPFDKGGKGRMEVEGVSNGRDAET